MTPTGTFTFQGQAGALEAIYRKGKDDSTRVAIVCHPLGYPTLRFNYRGVGRSEGLFDDGVGEADDVQAAINWLVTSRPGSDIVLCGFSFGAVVGLPTGAVDDRVTHLVGLGTPTDRFPFDLLSDITKPKLFIQGDADEFGSVKSLHAQLQSVAQPWELIVIEGADHFFTNRLDELQEALASHPILATV